MTIKKHFHINSFARKPRFETEAWSSSEMAYLLVLMYTGVTVVRKGSGGRGDNPRPPHFIHLPYAHPIDSCIDRTFYRQEKSSRHVALVAKCLDLNKPWSSKYGGKKMKR